MGLASIVGLNGAARQRISATQHRNAERPLGLVVVALLVLAEPAMSQNEREEERKISQPAISAGRTEMNKEIAMQHELADVDVCVPRRDDD